MDAENGSQPKIVNPDYKGEWMPPAIENPDYKGEWKRPLIPNPDFDESATLISDQ